MSATIGGGALAATEDAVAAQTYGGIGNRGSRSISNYAGNRSLTQEADVRNDHLAGGAQNPCSAAAVAGAITGFNRKITKGNKVKRILALAVSGRRQKSGPKQRHV